MRYVIVGGLATEEVADELLLCSASGSSVHRVSGDARRYFEQVRDGVGELPDDQVTAALVAAQVIAPVAAEAGCAAVDGSGAEVDQVDVVSRRRVMALGAAAAAAVGVVTVGLPSAAAAQSPGPAPAPVPIEYPSAPEEGTAPDPNRNPNYAAGQFDDSTDYFFDFSWFNFGSVPVTYSWVLYSPVSPDFSEGTVVGSGTATGRIPQQIFPSTVAGDTWLIRVTAVGGTQKAFTSTF